MAVVYTNSRSERRTIPWLEATGCGAPNVLTLCMYDSFKSFPQDTVIPSSQKRFDRSLAADCC